MQSLGKLCGGLVKVRTLRQHGAELVPQVGSFRFEFHGFFQLGSCAAQVAAETRDSSDSPVRFAVVRSQANSFARFGLGFHQIAISSQGVGEIDMSWREIRFQAQRDPKLGNRLPGLSLRK